MCLCSPLILVTICHKTFWLNIGFLENKNFVDPSSSKHYSSKTRLFPTNTSYIIPNLYYFLHHLYYTLHNGTNVLQGPLYAPLKGLQ